VPWLDSPTTDALTFVSRRLDAEPVAFLFAVRDPEGAEIRFPGADEMGLGGLTGQEATDLLIDRRGPGVGSSQPRVRATGDSG
jgi:hypothetical protein